MTLKKFEDCHVDINNKIAVIGFNNDDKIKNFLKQLIFLEFKVKEGQQIKEGDVIVVAEAMKGTSQLKSKVSGKVLAVNIILEDKFEKLKQCPTEWLVKIQMN